MAIRIPNRLDTSLNPVKLILKRLSNSVLG